MLKLVRNTMFVCLAAFSIGNFWWQCRCETERVTQTCSAVIVYCSTSVLLVVPGTVHCRGKELYHPTKAVCVAGTAWRWEVEILLSFYCTEELQWLTFLNHNQWAQLCISDTWNEDGQQCHIVLPGGQVLMQVTVLVLPTLPFARGVLGHGKCTEKVWEWKKMEM